MTDHFFFCHNTSIHQYVKLMWQLEGSPTYRNEVILPKGVVELIFSFSEPLLFTRNVQGEKSVTPRCFVSGITDEPLMLAIPAHQYFFGVVLHPLAVKKLLQVQSGHFLNAVIDLTLIYKEFNELWHKLGEAQGFHERVSITHSWVEKKLSMLHDQELFLSSYLGNQVLSPSVTDLASRSCYSVRQLNRKAHELFGMSAETLVRYKRYISSVQMLHFSNMSLTSVGHQCGFYDQPHFIREFKNYTGFTPGEYRKMKSHMPAHLFS